MNINVLQVCYVYPPFFSGYGKQLSTVNSYFGSVPDIDIQIITAYGKVGDRKVHSLFNFPRPDLKREKLPYFCFVFFAPFIFFRKFIISDIIHVVKAGPEVIVWVALAKIFGKRIIVKVVQEELEINVRVSFFKWIRLQSLKFVDAIIALSSKIESEALHHGISQKKIIRINNAFNQNKIEHFDSNLFRDKIVRESGFLNKKFKVITFVGAICYRKGILDLLNALMSYESEVKLILNLVGPDYKEIVNLSQLIRNVEQLGFVKVNQLGVRDDVVSILSGTDYLILPTYSEGMPNVVIESLMVGTPVIASNIPVLKDMITELNGVITEVGNANSILLGIKRAINCEYSRKVIINAATLDYSLEKVGLSYEKLYRSLK